MTFEDGSRLTTIQSPNYPNAYNSKSSCIWNVRGVSPDNHLVMRFIDFEMEPHPSCTDYVSIYNDTDAKGERVKKYCGDTVTLPVSVTGNQMSISFVTDGTGHFKGFAAEIEEVIQGIFVLFYQLHPIPDFGVSTAILHLVDISSRWCKLNFGPMPGQVISNHCFFGFFLKK